MSRNPIRVYIIFILLILSHNLRASEEISAWGSVIDTTISCIHWIVCPYCLVDSKRLLTRFERALDTDDIKTIAFIIRRRGFSPNQQLFTGDLPLTHAARKANVGAVQQLLKLGADVNSQLKGNQFESYPSALIAVCAAENLSPEQVAQTVATLLSYDADPTRTVVMLTESEKVEFEKLRKEYEETPSKERQILARISKEWFRSRTALDFAVKHNYLAAAQQIQTALISHRKKDSDTDGQTDETRPDNF